MSVKKHSLKTQQQKEQKASHDDYCVDKHAAEGALCPGLPDTALGTPLLHPSLFLMKCLFQLPLVP